MPDTSEDRDTKEALKEFDFLAASEEGDSESRSAGDGTDWGKECPGAGRREGRGRAELVCCHQEGSTPTRKRHTSVIV